ncbi:MAG: FkbM family methyltransferase [Candidatus Bathyarchaeia archaeon]
MLERFYSSLRESFFQALKTIGPICLEGNGVTHIILPDGFGCFEEIFFKEIYFDPEEIFHADVVIDLGAHQGTFATYSALNAKPHSMLVSVEPNPKAYGVLLENIHLLKHIIIGKRLKVYMVNKAVYISKNFVKLKLTRHSELSHISTSGDFEVQTITLREIFSIFQHFRDPKILLKMDIEGTEHDLLSDQQSLKFLEMCEAIAIEPHGNPSQIKETLEHLGFKVTFQNIILEPTLYRRWLKYKPRLYANVIAAYRLITSSIAKPRITIVKAKRK